MNAQALVCDERQQFTLEPVTLPDPGPGQVAIRTCYSGVSIGTEFALIRNKISWGPYPLCTGYMGTGIVEEVGPGVDRFKAGDRVYFRGNAGMHLASGAKVSCVSGTHCSRIVTQSNSTHGADPVPPGVSMEDAAMFVMPAVGLSGVDMANPRMGQTVVVYGAGLIGLGVIAACAHRGCTVIAVDLAPAALNLARTMGADHVIDASSEDVPRSVGAVSAEGADVVFECTGLPACIGPAIALCRRQGSFVWQGNYGSAPVPFAFLPAHAKRLQMFFPCDDGGPACRRAVLRNMAMGALRWSRCITHRITHLEAPEVYRRLNQGASPGVIGVVIRWPDADRLAGQAEGRS